MNYDTYEPFREFTGIEFTFIPSTFKVWKNQEIISQGDCKFKISSIQCSPYKDKILFYVNMNRFAKTEFLLDYIEDEFLLEYGITSTDRLLFLTLPKTMNVENDKINMLTQLYGITSNHKNFKPKEPYSCSVFTINGDVVKLSFNIAYPEYLIEFYI